MANLSIVISPGAIALSKAIDEVPHHRVGNIGRRTLSEATALPVIHEADEQVLGITSTGRLHRMALDNDAVSDSVCAVCAVPEDHILYVQTYQGRVMRIDCPDSFPCEPIRLMKEDHVIGLTSAPPEQQVLVHNGLYGLLFDGQEAQSSSRRGVKVLKGGLSGLEPVRRTDGHHIIITRAGCGYRLEEPLSLRHRGGKGVKLLSQALSRRLDLVVWLGEAGLDDHLIITTHEGRLLKVRVEDLPAYGRPAAGCEVANLPETDQIIACALARSPQPTQQEAEHQTPKDAPTPTPPRRPLSLPKKKSVWRRLWEFIIRVGRVRPAR